MSKCSSVDSEDDELFIDVDVDQNLPCYPLTTGGCITSTATVLSLQAMVDAVVDADPVRSPSSFSSRSLIAESSTASSPRCSPSLCRCRQDRGDAPTPGSWKTPVREKTVERRSHCSDTTRHRRLPDVVQLPCRRRSFLIEEILRPDFGRRRPPAIGSVNAQQKLLPVEVGRVASIWQPFDVSPGRTVSDDVDRELCNLPISTTATKPIGDRIKYSVKRKSQTGDVDDKTTARHIVQKSSRSSSSTSNGSESGSDVITTQNVVSQSKLGQLTLPAWVYCTRYSDRPSSGD